MDIRQLRYFCMVAEELNFTRAAQRLHMAQPPLSRQIQVLEQEIGAALFQRQARGLVLTQVGSYFLTHALQIIERTDTALSATRRMARKGNQCFGIGLAGSMLYGKLPKLISELKEKENLELSLHEMNTVEQVQALKIGRIDIGFGRVRLDDPEIDQTVIVEEPMVVMLPKGHFLEGRVPTLQEVADYPLIIYPASPRPSLADMVLGYFRMHGLRITVIQEVNEMQTAMGLVASNLGISLVPQQVMRMQRDDITYAYIQGTPITVPVILSRRKELPTDAMCHTLELVKRMTTESLS